MIPSSPLPFRNDPTTAAKHLIQSAHHRDGLPEILVGFTFLLVSGLICLQAVLPAGSTASTAAILMFSLLVPILCWASPAALRWLRHRYLIERSGYVRSNPAGGKSIAIGILLTGLVAAVLFGAVPRLSHPDQWLLAGTGLFGGALAVICGRLTRFIVGGVLIAATGLLLAFSGISLGLGFAVLFGFQGLLALLSGGVALRRFLRRPVEPDR